MCVTRKRNKKGKYQESIQAPHLTQDTNGKVTTSQLDITNMGQEVSPFPAGDHKASINRLARKHNKQDRNNINDPQKKHHLGTVSKNILQEGLNRFHGAPTSPLVKPHSHIADQPTAQRGRNRTLKQQEHI